MKAMIGGISFDVWKALIKSNPDYSINRAIYLSDHLGIDMTDIDRALRAADIKFDGITDTTGEHFGPIDRLNDALQSLGYDPSSYDVHQLVDDVQKLFLESPVQLQEAGLLKTLGKIKKRKKLAITSNTGFISGLYMRQALANVGILDLMDAVVFSDEVGFAKPDSRIFEQTTLSLGMPREHIVHIGDNLRADYDGAQSFGMQVVWLTKLATQDSNVVSAPSIKTAFDRGYLS